MFTLRYLAGSPWHHLNRAAFPWTYPDRETAETVRQACALTEHIEIVEVGESSCQ